MAGRAAAQRFASDLVGCWACRYRESGAMGAWRLIGLRLGSCAGSSPVRWIVNPFTARCKGRRLAHGSWPLRFRLRFWPPVCWAVLRWFHFPRVQMDPWGSEKLPSPIHTVGPAVGHPWVPWGFGLLRPRPGDLLASPLGCGGLRVSLGVSALTPADVRP